MLNNVYLVIRPINLYNANLAWIYIIYRRGGGNIDGFHIFAFIRVVLELKSRLQQFFETELGRGFSPRGDQETSLLF